MAVTSSEGTAPSSTPPRTPAISSDDAPLPSSPPSSPPGFPWERVSAKAPSPQRSAKTAFSVLGKRKALGEINENVLPRARPAHTSAKRVKKEDSRNGLTQMQISLGQRMQKRCKACGMEYVPSSEEDRKLHDKYHSQNELGYDVGKDFIAKAPPGTLYRGKGPNDTIIVVTSIDGVSTRRKARCALDIVQRELGAVDISNEELWSEIKSNDAPSSTISRYACYMYIKERRCIGLLVAEQILEAHRVLEPSQSNDARGLFVGDRSNTASAASALKARREASQSRQQSDTMLRLSQQAYPATIGISRIWVSSKFRRKCVATVLLDTAVMHGCQHQVQRNLHTEDIAAESWLALTCANPVRLASTEERLKHVAFSQPTDAGRRLAARWFGRSWGWMVYRS